MNIFPTNRLQRPCQYTKIKEKIDVAGKYSLIIIGRKKCFPDLFVGDKDPVNTIKKECRSHNYTNGLVDVEHPVGIEKQENPDAYIKHYHEDAKHGMKLLKYPVAVHGKMICDK